jgi:hypothetical protein
LAGAPKISFREKNSGKEDARKIEQADRQRKGGAREIACSLKIKYRKKRRTDWSERRPRLLSLRGDKLTAIFALRAHCKRDACAPVRRAFLRLLFFKEHQISPFDF